MGSTDDGHSTRGFGTLAVHAGAPHDPATGAVIESVCPRTSRDMEIESAIGTVMTDILGSDLPFYHLRPDQRWQPRRFVRVHS